MKWVVPAWTLQPYLEREVPMSASSKNVTLVQNPEIRVLSRTPKYLATVDSAAAASPAAPGAGPPAGPTSQQARRRVVANEILGVTTTLGLEVAADELSDDERAFEDAMQPERDRVVNAPRRPAFETRTGYTIVGAKVRPDAVPNGAGYEVVDEGGVHHVRIYDPNRSVVIRFEDGRGTCLPPVPGYVGSVQVEDGRVVAVNYTPSLGTNRHATFEDIRGKIEEHRSFVAVATRHGVFDLPPDEKGNYGDLLRRWKGVDPSLGIYATYAYAASGMVEKIRSIADYMKDDLRDARDEVNMPAPDGRDVTFYNVALYGRQIVPGQATPDGAFVLPCCPMMTQGWGYAASAQALAARGPQRGAGAPDSGPVDDLGSRRHASAYGRVRAGRCAMRLTFVHGRSQGGKDRVALQAKWERAMKEGFDAAGAQRPDELRVLFPFYGDKLDDLVKQADEGAGSDAKARSAAGTPAKHEELRGQLVQELLERSKLKEDDVDFMGDVKERGPLNWGWVQAILRVLDETSAGEAILDKFTRDVAVYLSYPAVARQIDAIVAGEIGPEPGVVVAHSLGTVVTYNVLRGAAKDVQVPLFMTLGSPLGLSSIRSKLGTPREKPGRVDTWVNAYDDDDVVALRPLNADTWPRAQPITNIDDLQNGTDNQHGISGYLNKVRVANVLHGALA